MVKFMVAYNFLQELVQEYREMSELSVDRYIDVQFRLDVRKVTDRRSTLRSNTRLSPPDYLSHIPTLDSLKNQKEQVAQEVLSIHNRLEFLERVVSTINDAKSNELSNLMSLVRRLRFAEERLILTMPQREVHLPVEVWDIILKEVMPNIQTINSNNRKLNRMLKR
ncbi:11262d84-c1dc-4c41-a338-95d4eaa1c6f8 [Sclerotinia trifoliorum]|uniref:11262d84-c1dc-4c41-a338-95d4eaa1c6f8 n=1 Tax=Sclerotinia trifoliorum TaxID=28548 RepID=A0A8H2VWN6_9HELO|nr:11262d84-c1dc-4c41-a338-95d4eaa1c6f8 [Sclerotinia trifoliorum]